MMAFFDSLVQRELEGWSTSDESQHDATERSNYLSVVQRGESDASDSDTLSNRSVHSAAEADDDGGHSPFTMAFAIAMARRARQAEGEAGSGDEVRIGLGGAGDADDLLDVHSSFMERVDELHNAGAEDSSNNARDTAVGALPGQRPNSARKSITELINQKRKEYLNKANKSECCAKKKGNKQKSQIVMETESTSCSGEGTSTGASGNASSSDAEVGTSKEKLAEAACRKKRLRKARAKKKKRLCTCRNNENRDLSPSERRRREETRKEIDQVVKAKIKRLRARRRKALLGLSDSSDSDNERPHETEGQNSSQLSSELYAEAANAFPSAKGAARTNPVGASRTASHENAETVKIPSNEENVIIDVENGFTDADFNICSVPILDSCDEKKTPCKVHTDESMDKESGSPPSKKLPFSSFCDKEQDASAVNGDPVNGYGSNAAGMNGNSVTNGLSTLPKGPSSQVNNGASTSHGEASTSAEPQPIWSEFKRFRNRVERARRQYRKRSSSQREISSSGDES